MMAQVIHYRALGQGGQAALVFPCWKEEDLAWWDSRVPGTGVDAPQEPGHWIPPAYTLPKPLVSANLEKVTCPRCWQTIIRMGLKRQPQA